MGIDFWNNPLVVSAFRVKNRRGGLFTGLTVYVSFLGCGCVAAWYLLPLFMGGVPVAEARKLHLIFGGLFVLQTALSALLAMNMTSTAMTVEVANGTLDFQRLTRLTPAQVLTGKLLGPPATAYLMAMGSVPFTFGLWALGAAPISFGTLVLLYLHLASTTLLGGALGLLRPLENTPAPKSPQEGSGPGCLLTLLFLMPAFGGLRTLPSLLAQPETAALMGLFLPTGPLVGLFNFNDPWHFTLNCFGMGIPFLLVTPLVQFALGALCFVIMSRRLTNTATPSLSKPMAYGILAVVDVLAAAVLFNPVTLELGPRSRFFWLCHVLVALFLVRSVTPDRELLRTWIWRFRGRYSRLRDLWWEDRSENVLVLLTFCGIGVFVYLLLVALPALLVGGWNAAQPTDAPVVHALLLACLLLLSLGTLLQSGQAAVGRGGGWFLALVVLFDLGAFMAGTRLQIRELLEASALAHWLSWRPLQEPLGILPVLGIYGSLFLFSWVVLRRNLRRETKKVEHKLQEMELQSNRNER